MNIKQINDIVSSGKQLNRSYFAYGTDSSITTVEAKNIDDVVKELSNKLKDKDNPLVITKFFYFDYIDFTGLGGEI